MIRAELERRARLPHFAVLHVGAGTAIVERASADGVARLIADVSWRLPRSCAGVIVAALYHALDRGWYAGFAQALLALEGEPEEAAALAARARRRGSAMRADDRADAMAA